MGLTISHYFPIDLSLIIFIVNAILFVLGAVVLGKKFALTTIISTFVYPTFLSVVRQIPGVADMTDNIMLATIYGGALLGLGIGLIVRVEERPQEERIFWRWYSTNGFIFQWQRFCML